MDQKTIRFFLVGSLLAMAAFIYATIEANRGVNADELRRIQVEQVKLAQCLLLELEAHRINSAHSDRSSALHHRYSFDPPAPQATDMARLPEDACTAFLVPVER